MAERCAYGAHTGWPSRWRPDNAHYPHQAHRHRAFGAAAPGRRRARSIGHSRFRNPRLQADRQNAACVLVRRLSAARHQPCHRQALGRRRSPRAWRRPPDVGPRRQDGRAGLQGSGQAKSVPSPRSHGPTGLRRGRTLDHSHYRRRGSRCLRHGSGGPHYAIGSDAPPSPPLCPKGFQTDAGRIAAARGDRRAHGQTP